MSIKMSINELVIETIQSSKVQGEYVFFEAAHRRPFRVSLGQGGRFWNIGQASQYVGGVYEGVGRIEVIQNEETHHLFERICEVLDAE